MMKTPAMLKRGKIGQGVVEFALVLPILLLVIFGVIEGGRLLFIYSAALTASREAARYGSAAGQLGIGDYTPHYEDCAGMRAAARRIGSLAGIQDDGITITYDQGPGTSEFANCNPEFEITDKDITRVHLGDRVIVQVNAAYSPLIPLINFSSFPINSISRRTILKEVSIEGTPPPTAPPDVFFNKAEENVSEDVGTVTLIIQMSHAWDEPVTVTINIAGTATQGSGEDFTVSDLGPFVIPPGSTSASLQFFINDDDVYEPDELVIASITNVDNASVGDPNVYVMTIKDNEDPPRVSFTLASQEAPEEADMVVEAVLDHPSSLEVSVPVAVSGTATSGELDDFIYEGTPIVIPPGSTGATISLLVNDDQLDELDETIILTMGAPVNADPGDITEHTATIIDNDTAVVYFTWEAQEALETSGTVIVEILQSIKSVQTVTIPFTIGGTAVEGEDYTVPTTSPVTIYPGETRTEIQVDLIADEVIEPPETVVFTLGQPTNAELGSPSVHTLTITEADLEEPYVSFSSSGQTVNENAGTATFNVQLSSAYYLDVTVPFDLSGTATQGPGQDYTITASPVVIPAGSASVQVVLTLNDDILDEEDETAIITMGTPINAIKGSPSVHTATITDNDDLPTVSFALAGQEGREDIGTMTAVVHLNTYSGKDVTAPFVVGGTAYPDIDFTISPSPVVIPAGSLSAEVLISVIDDEMLEENETVILTLSAPTNAYLGSPDTHTATILDNEPACPTPDSLPTFGSGSDRNKLLWLLQSPDPTRVLNLIAVTIRWPTGTNANVTAITFNSTLFSGSAPPPYLNVDSPYPLWSGAFSTQQMIYKFDKNPKSVPGDFYEVTATFEGCPPVSGVIPSD